MQPTPHQEPEQKGLNYDRCLQIGQLIQLQHPERMKNPPDHDFMVFIIVHQAYELWFKEILHELGSIVAIMSTSNIGKNTQNMITVYDRLKRINTVWHVLIKQMDIVKTLSCTQFLNFRKSLGTASGFQSYQFKMIETMLGLTEVKRVGGNYHLSQLEPQELNLIRDIESKPTLAGLLNKLLEELNYFDMKYWSEGASEVTSAIEHPFWVEYNKLFEASFTVKEEGQKKMGDMKERLFSETNPERYFTPKACRMVLFINCYQRYPATNRLNLFLNELKQIDSSLNVWRFYHMEMVKGMIGLRVGTGNLSTGYLPSTTQRHGVFSELNELITYFVETDKLPKLPQAVVRMLCIEE